MYNEKKRNEIERMSDEELLEYIKTIPIPEKREDRDLLLIKIQDAKENKRLELMKIEKELEEISKPTDIVADQIRTITTKTRVAEDQMLMVHGKCYTVILENEKGIEVIVSPIDPRGNEEYRDRIIHFQHMQLVVGDDGEARIEIRRD